MNCGQCKRFGLIDTTFSITVKSKNATRSNTKSTSSSISVRHMQEILDNLRTTRESTARNYYGIWKNFNKFVVCLDAKPKTWERRVALYGAYLVDKGI